MHWKRQLKRGYNQSNLLAIELGKRLNLSVDTSIITRSKMTHPQQGLTARERESNLCDAFKVDKPIPYKHIALVDDVVTTGTTINKVAELLRANNVERIDVICLSRTKY